MAISKTQPMRSAEVQLIDTVNTLLEQGNISAEAINTLHSMLGDGFNEERTVTSVTGAMSSAIQSISDEIGSGFTPDNTIAEAIHNIIMLLAKIQIGYVEVEIPASDSTSSTVNFDEPFNEEDKCIVVAQVSTEELLSLFEVTVIDCTYSGFSYSISNSDSDPHTVTLGYVAVNVN